jgi:hypothetical protein
MNIAVHDLLDGARCKVPSVRRDKREDPRCEAYQVAAAGEPLALSTAELPTHKVILLWPPSPSFPLRSGPQPI